MLIVLTGILKKYAWAFFFFCVGFFVLAGGFFGVVFFGFFFLAGGLGLFLSFIENCLQYFSYVWRRNYLTGSYSIFDTILLKNPYFYNYVGKKSTHDLTNGLHFKIIWMQDENGTFYTTFRRSLTIPLRRGINFSPLVFLWSHGVSVGYHVPHFLETQVYIFLWQQHTLKKF